MIFSVGTEGENKLVTAKNKWLLETDSLRLTEITSSRSIENLQEEMPKIRILQHKFSLFLR